MTYSFDVTWERERERLEIQATMLDPGTQAILERVGVTSGWKCAEVGAGAGSIARWLAPRVGRSGRVVATDRDTRFLEELRSGILEVRPHDITEEPVDLCAYDLVHARLVLMHLPKRARALRHLIASVRPGGWLVVEDYDLSTAGFFDPPSALQTLVASAVDDMFEKSGADPRFGIKLLPAFLAAGLEDVGAEARLQVVPLGTPKAEALALKLEQFKEKLVATGIVSAKDVDRAVAEARTASGAVHYPPLMVSCWGRKP